MTVILVTDGASVPEGAVRILRELGEVRLTTFDCSGSESDFHAALSDVSVLWVALGRRISRTLFDAAPRLTDVVTVTTGLDHIDLAEAEARQIRVHSLREHREFLATVHATAEHTWSLLLALARQVIPAHESVARGEWERSKFPGFELAGKSIGIVGLGRLGSRVAHYANAFDMRVATYDPYADVPNWVTRFEHLAELATASDVLTVHVPLDRTTTGLISAEVLECLPGHALLVNTSRGSIVNEQAVATLLDAEKLGGYAADVLAGEPDEFGPLKELLVRGHKRLVCTPHIGGNTPESRRRSELQMASSFAYRLLNERRLLNRKQK